MGRGGLDRAGTRGDRTRRDVEGAGWNEMRQSEMVKDSLDGNRMRWHGTVKDGMGRSRMDEDGNR